MDADPDQHSPERKMVSAPYFQILQAVVVQDAVVDPFTCGTLTVDLPVLLRITRDAWLKTQVVVIFYINCAAIISRGTFFFEWAGSYAFVFERTAVFMSIFYGIISPWTYFVACLTKRMAVFAESNVIRGVFRGLCLSVDIDERIDIPSFQQLISRDVVMCGVQADIF